MIVVPVYEVTYGLGASRVTVLVQAGEETIRTYCQSFMLRARQHGYKWDEIEFTWRKRDVHSFRILDTIVSNVGK